MPGAQIGLNRKQRLKNIKELEEINHMRTLCGIKQKIRKRRSCLGCDKLFFSNGIEERLCENCRRKDYD